MNTPTNFMNSKRRVIFQTEKGFFYSMSNGKKTMNPKAKFMKNTGKPIKNINQVPKSIRPAKAPAAPPATKTSKMMSKMKKNIAMKYKKTNNMSRTTTTPRPPSSPKSKPNLSNAVARMKASAAKLKANRVSTIKF